MSAECPREDCTFGPGGTRWRVRYAKNEAHAIALHLHYEHGGIARPSKRNVGWNRFSQSKREPLSEPVGSTIPFSPGNR